MNIETATVINNKLVDDKFREGSKVRVVNLNTYKGKESVWIKNIQTGMTLVAGNQVQVVRNDKGKLSIIDYEAAEYQLEAEGCYPQRAICPEDDNCYYRWGVRDTDANWKIEPIHEDKESAIEDYFENYLGGCLCEYRHEVF